MKQAYIYVDGKLAGVLQEITRKKRYCFIYENGYEGESVSLTMPIEQRVYEYDQFPPFFESLLPEGMMLEGLLRGAKLDRDDLMGQLITVGQDLVGNITVEEVKK